MIELCQVTLAGSGRPRLNSVSLKLDAGRTAVVGYSGAGKTSLLHVLAGFETASAGRITTAWNGDTSGRLPLYWVPQNDGLWPHLTVRQHLAAVNNSVDSADEILSRLDLEQRRHAFPSELSQGERSRLALARGLMTHAKLLLLDEPLSHVDPGRKPHYWRITREYLDEYEMSIVFSSHEPETVLRQADRVICLHQGTVVFQGTTQSLYESPPSLLAGEFVGVLNWFGPQDAIFLPTPPESLQEGIGIRPERLRMVADPGSELLLKEVPFCGHYTESIVQHSGTNNCRRILHTREERMPRCGERVSLELTGAECRFR